jgi:NADP-dependent 3-hydroxy acid dehydrogenase YdfG
VYSATKHAVRVISEGLRQEVKPYNIRSTVISPGAVATELPNSITEPDLAASVRELYERVAISADSFANMLWRAGRRRHQRNPVPADQTGTLSK